MTGIDTNVLVRYIAQDDPHQAEAASEFIESTCTPEQPGYINHIVLCEIVWVLQRCYKVSSEEALRIIEQILRTEQFQVQSPEVVWQALREARSGRGDFADNMNLAINKEAGCEQTVTFDKALHGTDGVFVLLSG